MKTTYKILDTFWDGLPEASLYNSKSSSANKLVRKVIAPSDTVWIHPNGRMTIEPNARTDTGNWISYYPKKTR